MNANELIAKQQLEIENLKIRLAWANDDKASIASRIICVGGPLNDNCFAYTNKQLSLFRKILDLAEAGDREDLN